MHCPIPDNECPQVDSCKFRSVKVNIAFHKTLEDASKVDTEGESLNKCSEFCLFFVFMGSPKGRKGCHHRAWSRPFARLMIDG